MHRGGATVPEPRSQPPQRAARSALGRYDVAALAGCACFSPTGMQRLDHVTTVIRSRFLRPAAAGPMTECHPPENIFQLAAPLLIELRMSVIGGSAWLSASR